MAPIEARYFINSEERESAKSNKDGEDVVLETPVGKAWASLDPRKYSLDGTLGERFLTKFPGVNACREFISIFDIRKILSYKKDCNIPELIRKKTYHTNEGELVIELKAINSNPPGR